MAQRGAANTKPVLRDYCDRSRETNQHLDEIMRRTSTFMTITAFFMRDLQHQRDSLESLQELLDFPPFIRKGQGLVIDPTYPRECESSRTKSFIDECYDKSGTPIWNIPPNTTLEEFRREKSRLLELVGAAIAKMVTCLRGMPETENKQILSKLEGLNKLNESQALILDFWAHAEEKRGFVTELRRICVSGGYSVDDYIVHALEGDCRVLSFLDLLSQKVENLP